MHFSRVVNARRNEDVVNFMSKAKYDGVFPNNKQKSEQQMVFLVVEDNSTYSSTISQLQANNKKSHILNLLWILAGLILHYYIEQMNFGRLVSLSIPEILTKITCIKKISKDNMY